MATTHSNKALAALTISFISLIALTLAAECSARARPPRDGCTGAYQWPVKPFDQAHPVRGNFGDPRTGFFEPLSEHALLEGDGTFSFHQGVDINAPDGTPVYAVASGRVTFAARRNRVTVSCGNGRSFEYWHIDPVVRVGQRVEVGKTVLGHILPMREHVHLTELDRRGAVNPLAPGHLTPYRDETSPKVLDITFRDEKGLNQQIDPLHGRVFFVAEAIDTPALPVRGRWAGGYPVTPALITWRIERDGRIVVPERVAWDVRKHVPRNDRFWDKYARGTYGNWPKFNSIHYRYERGRYLFKLSSRPFDTGKLTDGVYELVVTASDTAGNRGVGRLRLALDNASVRAGTARAVR